MFSAKFDAFVDFSYSLFYTFSSFLLICRLFPPCHSFQTLITKYIKNTFSFTIMHYFELNTFRFQVLLCQTGWRTKGLMLFLFSIFYEFFHTDFPAVSPCLFFCHCLFQSVIVCGLLWLHCYGNLTSLVCQLHISTDFVLKPCNNK